MRDSREIVTKVDERLGDDGQHEGQQRDSNQGRRIRDRLIQQDFGDE